MDLVSVRSDNKRNCRRRKRGLQWLWRVAASGPRTKQALWRNMPGMHCRMLLQSSVEDVPGKKGKGLKGDAKQRTKVVRKISSGAGCKERGEGDSETLAKAVEGAQRGFQGGLLSPPPPCVLAMAIRSCESSFRCNPATKPGSLSDGGPTAINEPSSPGRKSLPPGNDVNSSASSSSQFRKTAQAIGNLLNLQLIRLA